MSFENFKKQESMEIWPWILPSQLIDIHIMEAGGINVEPNKGVQWDDFLLALRERIRATNGELLRATTRDDVAAIEARLKLFRDEQEKIIAAFHRIAIEGLRRGYFVGYGFRDTKGTRTIILPGEWPQSNMDWIDGTVTIGEKRYTDVRFLRYSNMPEIQHAINRDLREAGEFVPGGPGEVWEPSQPEMPSTPENSPPDKNQEATATCSGDWAFLPQSHPYRARVIAICCGAAWIIKNRKGTITYGNNPSANKIADEFINYPEPGIVWWDKKALEGDVYGKEKVAEWVNKWLKAGQPDPNKIV